MDNEDCATRSDVMNAGVDCLLVAGKKSEFDMGGDAGDERAWTTGPLGCRKRREGVADEEGFEADEEGFGLVDQASKVSCGRALFDSGFLLMLLIWAVFIEGGIDEIVVVRVMVRSDS